jgi:hypothetical protein
MAQNGEQQNAFFMTPQVPLRTEQPLINGKTLKKESVQLTGTFPYSDRRAQFLSTVLLISYM